MNFGNLNVQDLQLEHSIDINPSSGAASATINIPIPEGRENFNPSYALSYSSAPTKSVFGIGWHLQGVSYISIDTKDGFPKYDGTDNFAFNGGQVLVPMLIKIGLNWQPRIEENAEFWIYYYHVEHEDAFTRFEKWVHKITNQIHWRTVSKNNIVSIYGKESLGNTKCVNPTNENNIFIWFIETQYDNNGNAIQYTYIKENADNVNTLLPYETKRLQKFKLEGFAQKYLNKILYGNTKVIMPDLPMPIDNKWLFEVVFDYGQYESRPYTNTNPIANATWAKRLDPFSTYNAGFEVRTYRLCKRILTYNNFNELSNTPSLTGIFECIYNEDEVGTTLQSVKFTGVRKNLFGNDYSEKELPPLVFNYTKAQIGKSFQGIIKETNENIPLGFSNYKTKIVDLFCDGMPGILTETNGAWYYKPNLGNGVFGKQEVVINKPSQDIGAYSLGDFDLDGNINLFALQGKTAGYFEYNKDSNEWQGFMPFKNIPQVANAKFIDVTGDGFTDIVVECDDKIVCYPLKGKDGFGESFEFAKSIANNANYAPMIGEDLHLDYFLADMCGDGLLDQVRILNGRVEYFPNLGNGRFGEVVVMENAPVFDFSNAFDASKIRLFDLDGSGTSDIIYLANGTIKYWYNASGNKFIEGGTISNLPYIDNISTANIVDFLGNGTPCLVWSNFLTHLSYSTIQYLELTSGIKPRLLTSLHNSMGNEVQIEYGYSGNHYLHAIGNTDAWITKMPSHFTVVDKKIVHDYITNATITTQYKYRDGHYNGNERSFITFGLVEQYDTQVFANSAETHDKDYVQPSCAKTWLHSGIFGWDSKRAKQYYNKDVLQQILVPQRFEQTEALDADDFELGYRCLAGRIIRQEIYAVNEDGALSSNPYQINQNAYSIRKLQPKTALYNASFYAYTLETTNSQYDQQANDPKIAHSITIELSKFGDIAKDVQIAYARRTGILDTHTSQTKDYITIGTNSYLEKDERLIYQTGILFESKRFEVNKLIHAPNKLVEVNDVKSIFNNLLLTALAYHEVLSAIGTTQAKLISWDRTYFWNDAFNNALPLGILGTRIFAHHEESACFNTNTINNAFAGKVTLAMLANANEGNYIEKDGYWWQRDPINYFNNVAGFFTLQRTERQTGSFVNYTYDDYFINIIQTVDEVGNVTKGVIDYNVVEPYRMIDPNENITEVLYDPLGIIIASFNQGTILDENGNLQKYGNGLLAAYSRRNDENFSNIIANPALYLQEANSFVFYDNNCWKDNNIPLRTITIARENNIHNGKGNIDNSLQYQIKFDYQDGFGRIIQTKQKVEAGPAIKRKVDKTIELDSSGKPVFEQSTNRYVVTGHIVYNNKQQPIRQFEPFFSSMVDFENDALLESYGVAAHSYYDAVGRTYKTELPNGTYTEMKFNAWETKMYDQNDTVNNSFYKTFRDILPNDNPEKMALTKALQHNDTPTIVKTDPLNREVCTILINNDTTQRKVENQLDINGNIIAITDARNLTAFEYKRDMLGRQLYEKSNDAGEKWSFYNSYDQPIHLWDSRNIHQETNYDILNRVLSVNVDGALGLNQITERFVYGDAPTITQAKERNLRGKLVKHYDQAGTQEMKLCTPNGFTAIAERKLLNQFTTEVNWNNIATVTMSADNFISKYEYDALDRPIIQELPDNTIRKAIFNRGGGIQKLLVSTKDGQLVEKEFIKDALYDTKGLRQRVVLGNDVAIDYTYDIETFKLNRLFAHKITGSVRTYQDIRYTYDPIGNLIYFIDQAQQTTAASPQVLSGLNVSAHNEFDYDALYQLITAKGRVHQALLQNDYIDRSTEIGVPANWGKGTRHIGLNNGASVERYTRSYAYDIAGNIKTIKHVGTTQNWTNAIWTSATSNRSLPMLDLAGNAIASPESFFDANGNCTSLPNLRSITWNYRNNIAKTIVIDRTAQGKLNDEEYYVYGGDGMRIRKITQRVIDVANNIAELTEKIYLEGCEIKRITRGGTEILKRTTSHITDGTNNIALMHAWEKDTLARETDSIAQKKIHYQLSNHLGSASLELDELGDIITYEEYFPYGGTSFIAGRNKRDIDLKDYRYSGKERDDFTGLYYFGYRYYAHWIGGWVNPDPIGPEDSENLYLYVQNNPINLVDPNGLQSTDLPETNVRITGTFGGISEAQRALLRERTAEARETLMRELGTALTDYFGPGSFAWHTENGKWTWVTGNSTDSPITDGTLENEANGTCEAPTAEAESSCEPESSNTAPTADETVSTPTPEVNSCSTEAPNDSVSDGEEEACSSCPCEANTGDGNNAEADSTSSTINPEPYAFPFGNNDAPTPNGVYIVRIIVQEGARPTAGSVFQSARSNVGSPRTFTPGEPLFGPYNLWSNEPAGGLLDAANAPGYIMEDTVLEDIAEATARRLGYSGRYDSSLRFGDPNFNQAHFNEVWNPTSDALATRAGLSQTPITSNGLESWRTPAHPNPAGTVQMSREIPRIMLTGGLMAQFAKVSGVITIVVSSQVDNPYVRNIGMASGAVEFAGGSAYLLGVADVGGGYFGATGATRLMTFGSGAARVGGGVGMIVLSGYSGYVHYQNGEYGVMLGDAGGVGMGGGVLLGAGAPTIAVTGTAMAANYLGDYVEREVTPAHGRVAGVAAGTGAGLAVGGVVGGGVVAFGLASNPVGWGILAVGGVAGLIGALW